MTPEILAEIKERLSKRAQDLLARGPEVRQLLREQLISRNSTHSEQADAPINSLLRDEICVSLNVLELEVVQVLTALSRIEAGTYGYCLASGRRMSVKRLMAKPEAPLCLGCQQKLEGSPRDGKFSRTRGIHPSLLIGQRVNISQQHRVY